MIDSLIDRDDLDPDEEDYLDVLGDLTERYEEEKHPLRPVTDAEMLAFLIEQKQVSQSAVARATDIAVSTISEVLSGKRTLRREHIARLARFFHVDQGVFALVEQADGEAESVGAHGGVDPRGLRPLSGCGFLWATEGE